MSRLPDRHLSTVGCALATLFSLATLCAATRADTLKVPDQFASIQAAVDAAAPGDRILIAPGLYVENVVVPAGLDGLTIQGAGSGVILDGRPQGATGTGAALGVAASDDVTIRGLTVRNALTGDVGFFSAGLGIDVVGDGALIDKCIVTGSSFQGILVTGDGARVQNCVLNGNDGGIEVEGDDALITKCIVDNDTFAGCGIFGIHGTISKCRVTNIELYGLWIDSGPDSTITGCTAIDAGDHPVWVLGDNPTVTKNTIQGASWQQTGMYFEEGTGGLVSGNKILDVAGNALMVLEDVAELQVVKNQFLSCAIQDFSALLVAGTDNTFSSNTITGSGHGAIEVTGAGNAFTGNKISGVAGIGIFIQAAAVDTVLQDNSVLNCTTEGLWNDGTSTTATGNTFRGSRLDVTSSAAFLEFSDNVLVTGGESTPPVDF